MVQCSVWYVRVPPPKTISGDGGRVARLEWASVVCNHITTQTWTQTTSCTDIEIPRIGRSFFSHPPPFVPLLARCQEISRGCARTTRPVATTCCVATAWPDAVCMSPRRRELRHAHRADHGTKIPSILGRPLHRTHLNVEHTLVIGSAPWGVTTFMPARGHSRSRRPQSRKTSSR